MDTRSRFVRAWVRNSVIAHVGGLGLLLPTLGRVLTGPHGQVPTLAQLVAHSLALSAFGVILCAAQNRAVRRLDPRRPALQGAPAFALLPLPFWIAYHLLYVPFDLLFLFAAIGVLNAVHLRPLATNPRSWPWLSVLVSLAAATTGISAGVGVYFGLTQHMTGVVGEYVQWIAIAAPAGIVSGIVGRILIGRTPARGAIPGPNRPFMLGIQDSLSLTWPAEERHAGPD